MQKSEKLLLLLKMYLNLKVLQCIKMGVLAITSGDPICEMVVCKRYGRNKVESVPFACEDAENSSLFSNVQPCPEVIILFMLTSTEHEFSSCTYMLKCQQFLAF